MAALDSENSADACNELKNDESAFKICNNAVAKNAKNMADCDKISLNSSKALCAALVQNNPALCENINLEKWDVIKELGEVSDCKTEIALAKAQPSPADALEICSSIRLTESMAARLNEMNDIATGKSQEEYRKNICKETILSRLILEKNSDAESLCISNGGQMSEDKLQCKFGKY